MDNEKVWLVLGIVSIIFGVFSRIAAYKIIINKETYNKIKRIKFENGGTFWFFEVWRDSVAYFVTCVIGYFLIVIRWPNIVLSGSVTVSDFTLGLVFLMGALGWLPYFVKNITEGINAIVTRFLAK